MLSGLYVFVYVLCTWPNVLLLNLEVWFSAQACLHVTDYFFIRIHTGEMHRTRTLNAGET